MTSQARLPVQTWTLDKLMIYSRPRLYPYLPNPGVSPTATEQLLNYAKTLGPPGGSHDPPVRFADRSAAGMPSLLALAGPGNPAGRYSWDQLTALGELVEISYERIRLPHEPDHD
jgi:hypothetical protein